MKSMRRAFGMTLIELVIVVLIVGILAAVALPAYNDQVRRAKRGDATGSLKATANALERHFTVNTTYATATLGCAATDTFVPTSPIDEACQVGGEVNYNLVITAATQTTYTLQAQPVGDQVNDDCGTLILDQAGVKGATGANWNQCW
jgi:type IV pilus assembly protein PilE